MRNQHIDDLSTLRTAYVASRREAAARGTADAAAAGLEIIRLQGLIEAIDRAVRDELLLQEGEIGRARQTRQLSAAG